MINIPICQDIPMIKPIEKTVSVVLSLEHTYPSLDLVKDRLEAIQNDIDPTSPEFILIGRMVNSIGSIKVDLKKFEKSAREAYSRR